jgi:hypothetical protein
LNFLAPIQTPDGPGLFIAPTPDGILASVTVTRTVGDPPRKVVTHPNRIYGYCPQHGAHPQDAPCPVCVRTIQP